MSEGLMLGTSNYVQIAEVAQCGWRESRMVPDETADIISHGRDYVRFSLFIRKSLADFKK